MQRTPSTWYVLACLPACYILYIYTLTLTLTLLPQDDIAKMNSLHEAPLLDLLRRRYWHKDIYTFTGDILISLNPYCNIEGTVW